MAFVFRKPTGNSKPKDLRLSLPPELWTAISMVAAREELDPQEIIRQVLAHTFRKELRQVEASTTPKFINWFVETILRRAPNAPADLRQNPGWLDEFIPTQADLVAPLEGPEIRALIVKSLLSHKGLEE